MKCPFCSNKETCVIETRETDEDTTRRRRECLKCKKRFTTYEKPENFNLRIIKKDGNRELFDKEKIRKGVLKACEKRPVSNEAIDAFVDDIEKTLRNKHPHEVKSSVIGNLVVNRLKKLDSVAYIRFASVYREFADLTDLQDEIKKLLRENKKKKQNSK
ncbi:transcriptional regulator NrdR [Candidatus Woesearchaeota archaeon]|nr:transcriptional regulator NrdR [Candidatus Woesearchaeota archaeon]